VNVIKLRPSCVCVCVCVCVCMYVCMYVCMVKSLCFNLARRHEDVLGSGGIAPRIL
jgi:hypothetical protein